MGEPRVKDNTSSNRDVLSSRFPGRLTEFYRVYARIATAFFIDPDRRGRQGHQLQHELVGQLGHPSTDRALGGADVPADCFGRWQVGLEVKLDLDLVVRCVAVIQ